MGSPYFIKTIINKTFSQRFFWSRLSQYPLMGRLIESLLFKGDDIIYLPEDRAIPISKNIPDTSQNTVMPSQVLEHFIRQAKYHWIMDFCICRDSAKCEDYPIDLGCIFLGEAAKGINPKFSHRASVEETLEHAARCRDAGLVHLIGLNKLDSVWLNVGPKKKLLTICNCCPCCCLWKILPQINASISSKVNRMPGVRVAVTDLCVGCGKCTKEICFVDAIHLEEGHAAIDDTCRGCGRCVSICPNQAIEIKMDIQNPVSAAIDKIENLVDLT
ncbi:MAG: 4Fe-4S binding protein [Desulfobacter sp.]|nr:MAG: 4Fe-4S binding protein [Desulfobacter sp.]